MEIYINKFWFIIDAILIKNIVLQFVIELILIVFIIHLINDLKDYGDGGNKFMFYSYIDFSFYKFLKLHFVFIIIFLLDIFLLLGVLEYNIIECLISKYILALIFFIWSTMIYLIDITFIKYYIHNDSKNDYYNYKRKVNIIWALIKLIISVLFIIYFGIGLYLDLINLFV